MKKIIAALLAAALTLALAACGGAEEKFDLTVMGKRSDMEKPYMTRVFDRYESAAGGKLKIVAVEDSEFEAAARETFEKGEGPDILMHFNNADLNRFDLPGSFLYLDDQPWVGELTDSALAYCLDGEGNLLGLPFWESSVSGCYYNKTLLEELGLRPAATQSEFDVLCRVLTEMGRTPICWPGDGCSWMLQFALDPVFADDRELLDRLNAGEAAYTDIPAVTDAVAWIDGAAKSGWFGDDYMKTGWDGISAALSSGEALMTFIWDTWFYTDFTPGKYTVDDFALMPVFMGTAEEGTYEGGNLNMMMVNRNSPRVEKALEFLSFCARPENYNAAFEGISTVSCFTHETTNVQSAMVTDAAASIAQYERVSTASTRVVGYSADEAHSALNEMLRGRLTVGECVKLMDEYRRDELARE